MKKYILGFLVCCLWAFPAFCAETENAESAPDSVENQVVPDEQPMENPADMIRYTQPGQMPEIKELSKEEDDLYSGADVKPMDIKISSEEKQKDPSTDLDYIDKEFVLPELSCDNDGLARQVAAFIKNHTKDEDSSVKGRRNRILMVKNMHKFTEISEEDLDKNKNFSLRAVVAHLRINEHREIYKVCESKNNKSGKFNNVYIVIYPDFKYYKVVVTNLLTASEKTEEVTFTYNW